MSQEKIFQFRRRFDSLYWQQFLLTAGMVLLTLLLLGVSFYGLSYNDTVAERRSEMRQHAELIANMSGDYLASNGQTQSPSLQNLVALAAGLTKADFLLCNQEGYALLTSDQRLGGKVVSVPQDIQDAILGDQGFYQGRSSIGGAYDLKQFVVGVPVTREDGSTVFASESCALGAVGAKFLRDLLPGEIVTVDETGVRSDRSHCGKTKKTMCIFEYIYFARSDSVMDGVGVHEARKKAGMLLAKAHPVEADLVVGVPDSGLDAALGYAEAARIPFGLGFLKNRYIGRTFISPGQGNRMDLVRMKLSPIVSEVKGKRIVLIDDSIVRGTTCGQIVNLLRSAGAREVHMRISSPPFLNPCYYGTDIDSRDHLIACQHSVEEIRDMIGADSLGYLPIEDLPKLIGSEDFCSACFSGNYPTRIPADTAKDKFEAPLSQRGKEREK